MTENTIVIHNDENAREAIVFQYNENDLDALIQESNPTSKVFYLPRRTYEKRNLLVFVDGYRTTNYYIAGDTIVLQDKEIPSSIEVYVFKQYDYLYLDKNKYNSRNYDFITKNIKRSIFF
jgi:hypothetical protein